ncbi:MAG: beta-lactamase family protein [Spirochaetaceae bacterium]
MELLEVSHKIKELFSEFNIKNHPGSQIGIIHKGNLIFEYAYGLADLERGTKITCDTIFDIASISKQFVAYGILLLQNDGLLELDDSLHKYFPDFPQLTRQNKLKNLLNHTSGIQDYMDLMESESMSESNMYQDADIMKLIVLSKLEDEPGEKFTYSNSNYFLLAQIIEIVAKVSFPEYMNTKIFNPLGMNNTTFYNDHKQIIPNRALSYSTIKDGKHENFPYIFNIVGDTGLLTNVHDLAKWDNCFFQSNSTLINCKLHGELQKKSNLNNGDKINYGYGLFVDDFSGFKTINHDGAAAGYRSEMLRFPQKDITIISLSNFSGMKRVVYEIGEILLGNY